MLNCADKSALKVGNPREYLCLDLFATRLKKRHSVSSLPWGIVRITALGNLVP